MQWVKEHSTAPIPRASAADHIPGFFIPKGVFPPRTEWIGSRFIAVLMRMKCLLRIKEWMIGA